jgi:hypothetical protein
MHRARCATTFYLLRNESRFPREENRRISLTDEGTPPAAKPISVMAIHPGNQPLTPFSREFFPESGKNRIRQRSSKL